MAVAVEATLGVEPTVEVDVTEIPVDKDDVFLLCSDGLSDMVDDDDIQLTISTFGANLETLAKQLVLLGNDNGGRDNISIVLVRALDSFPAEQLKSDRVFNIDYGGHHKRQILPYDCNKEAQALFAFFNSLSSFEM